MKTVYQLVNHGAVGWVVVDLDGTHIAFLDDLPLSNLYRLYESCSQAQAMKLPGGMGTTTAMPGDEATKAMNDVALAVAAAINNKQHVLFRDKTFGEKSSGTEGQHIHVSQALERHNTYSSVLHQLTNIPMEGGRGTVPIRDGHSVVCFVTVEHGLWTVRPAGTGGDFEGVGNSLGDVVAFVIKRWF